MHGALEAVIDTVRPAVYVLTQRFLPVELWIVAALQPLVVIRRPIEQEPVFERLRSNAFISSYRRMNEAFINPVMTLRRPHSEAAQPGRLRVAQPRFQPHPRFFACVGKLINAKP